MKIIRENKKIELTERELMDAYYAARKIMRML